MKKTLGEIARLIGGEVVGDRNLPITGVAGIKEAKEGDITFLANSKYLPLYKSTRASAVIVDRNIIGNGKPLIRTDNPYLAFARVMRLWEIPRAKSPIGIHPTAVIEEKVYLGKNVSIGAQVVIEKGAEIGDGVILYPQVYVGYGAKIGANTVLYPNVTVKERAVIGKRVIIHSGTVVGSDGFGFVPHNGTHHKIPQMGRVVIEDDVEIGANVTIDRATFGETLIKRGTKIDNLVQIAHNVVIGENCIIVAQVGICGSVTLEKEVTLAGQVGVVGHLTIGEGTVVAAKSVVTKDIPSHQFVSGYPARDHFLEKKIKAVLPRLPELLRTIQKLQARIEELERKVSS